MTVNRLLVALLGPVVLTSCAQPEPNYPVIDSFTTVPTTVVEDGPVTFEWDLSGGKPGYVEIYNDSGGLIYSGAGDKLVYPEVTTTYTLKVGNDWGRDEASSTVTVTRLPGVPYIDSFTAEPPRLEAGEETVLSWTLSNGAAERLVLEPGVGAVVGTSVTVAPLAPTTYFLTASNDRGSDTARLEVLVVTP